MSNQKRFGRYITHNLRYDVYRYFIPSGPEKRRYRYTFIFDLLRHRVLQHNEYINRVQVCEFSGQYIIDFYSNISSDCTCTLLGIIVGTFKACINCLVKSIFLKTTLTLQ